MILLLFDVVNDRYHQSQNGKSQSNGGDLVQRFILIGLSEGLEQKQDQLFNQHTMVMRSVLNGLVLKRFGPQR